MYHFTYRTRILYDRTQSMSKFSDCKRRRMKVCASTNTLTHIHTHTCAFAHTQHTHSHINIQNGGCVCVIVSVCECMRECRGVCVCFECNQWVCVGMLHTRKVMPHIRMQSVREEQIATHDTQYTCNGKRTHACP